jgi:hypothetical protein
MALGEPVAGIVGYQAFQASVVELDMDRATVSLYDPTAYQLTPQGRWAPLFVLSNHPCCTARFEGDREAVFRLDSGGAGTVLFHTQAVDRLKLLDGRKTTASVLGGVGGLIVSRRGTLDWFELGGYRFEKPTADFSRSNKGAAQGIVIVGTIGHELLKRFQIVLDYHQRRVAFLDRTH